MSDLQSKDVVELETGNKLGNVIDASFTMDGKINNIVIYGKKGLFNKEEVYINWEDIKRIGQDVILVIKK